VRGKVYTGEHRILTGCDGRWILDILDLETCWTERLCVCVVPDFGNKILSSNLSEWLEPKSIYGRLVGI